VAYSTPEEEDRYTITAEFPLEKFDDAIALIGRGGAFKVILKP
jgi:hypothetical protein